jgi:recombination endonuclease VII
MSSCRLCEVPSVRYSLGLCRSHYEKELRQRNPEYAERQRENTRRWVDKNGRPSADPVYKARKGRLRTERKREALLGQLANQGGQCALCGVVGAAAWHQDHDHETNRLRAVLCSKCNNGLGFFDDSPDLLREAATYVEQWKGVLSSAAEGGRSIFSKPVSGKGHIPPLAATKIEPSDTVSGLAEPGTEPFTEPDARALRPGLINWEPC